MAGGRHTPVVSSIQVGMPQLLSDESTGVALDRPWTTGIVKAAVSGRLHLGRLNLEGDGQADLVNHGGPDKAVLAYPIAHYVAWQEELPNLGLAPGAFGENFTVRGPTEDQVCIGDIFSVGGARVQVSQPRRPCWKLARRHLLPDLALRVELTGRSGWYLRVLETGLVEPGDELVLLERPNPAWSVRRAALAMRSRNLPAQTIREIAALRGLSDGWRAAFARRLGNTVDSGDSRARLVSPNEPP